LDLEPTTRDPRQINDEDPTKGIGPATARLQAEGLPVTDETIFISASLKDKGIAFLKGEGSIAVRKKVESAAPAAAEDSGSYQVSVAGKTYQVQLDGDAAVVNGQRYPVSVRTAGADSGAGAPASRASGTEVRSELPGKVLRVLVGAGDAVTEGQVLLLLEALKMEIEVSAPCAGSVGEVAVSDGQQVASGDLLLAIG
jgi:pyruvate carboxylase subunit B